MKKFCCAVLSAIMLLGAVLVLNSTVVTAGDISVYVNDSKVYFPSNDAQPTIIDNRTYVPFRAVCDALDIDISWNSGARELEFTRGSTVIRHIVGTKYIECNGLYQYFDTPSVVKNNRTLMPIRMLTEALNFNVSWDGNTRTVYIGNHTASSSSSSYNTLIGSWEYGDWIMDGWGGLYLPMNVTITSASDSGVQGTYYYTAGYDNREVTLSTNFNSQPYKNSSGNVCFNADNTMGELTFKLSGSKLIVNLNGYDVYYLVKK